MTMKFSMTRDINGYNAFGLKPSNVIYGVYLSQNVAQTVITLPDDSNNYFVIYSFTPGSNVFVDYTKIAAAYTGTPGAVTAELNPQGREYPPGTAISMLCPDANGAYVEVAVYALAYQ